MVTQFLPYTIALLALLVASKVDLKERIVPDWISYGTISAGLVIALLRSATELSYGPLLNSLAGLALGFGIGVLMFYTGQWGGGDAKLIGGIGALVGLLETRFFGNFLILVIASGALYGILYATFIAFKHRKEFSASFKEHAYTPLMKRFRIFFQVLVLIALIFAFFVVDDTFSRIFIVLSAAAAYLVFYGFLCSKALEGCMKRMIPVNKLMEGDWVLEEIKIGKGNGKGKKNATKVQKIIPAKSGITEEQIELLKKAKIKSVLVKEGIPFVPSFLIAYVATLLIYVWQGIDLLTIVWP